MKLPRSVALIVFWVLWPFISVLNALFACADYMAENLAVGMVNAVLAVLMLPVVFLYNWWGSLLSAFE